MNVKDWATEFEKVRKKIQLKRQSCSIFDEKEVCYSLHFQIIPLITAFSSLRLKYILFVMLVTLELTLILAGARAEEEEGECMVAIGGRM